MEPQLLCALRDAQDQLLKGFRAVTEGAKELRLHAERRNAFLTEVIENAANDSRTCSARGLSIFTVTSIGGHCVYFAIIGLLIFVLSRSRHVLDPVTVVTGAS